jgi:hypothetical protein
MLIRSDLPKPKQSVSKSTMGLRENKLEAASKIVHRVKDGPLFMNGEQASNYPNQLTHTL